MSELQVVRFDNFRVGVDSVHGIGAVPDPDTAKSGPGVAEDIKTAFGYEGDDLGGLIGHVAPHRELQLNIDFAKATLSDPAVQARLGQEGRTAAEIARSWSERSGLQTEVFRPFMSPADGPVERFEAAEIPERVPNWLERMGDTAIKLGRQYPIGILALASSDREIGPDEKPGVAEGTPSESYMEQTLLPRLEAGRTREEAEAGDDSGRPVFGSVEMIKTGEKAGDAVMAGAAAALAERGIDLATAKIVVFSVAGNWMQTGVQARQGLQTVYPDFDRDPADRQLWVKSDTFPIGLTGDEPKTTHQNPFSAIGNVLRGIKLLDEVRG